MTGKSSGISGCDRNRKPRTSIALEPLKDQQEADPKERVFLEAAERGDKHTIIRCLRPPNSVNVNCSDILGRSAIQIAVDNENIEIVELLLQQENVRIGDALLYAIREGVYKIVEMLINHPSISSGMLANEWYKSHTGTEESSDYSPDISPIILAAHCNQFEIVQLLLSRGARIDKPHQLSCSCQKCREGLHTDSLRYSLRRIHTYKALASPAWMSLTSDDPILTAFRLSWELEHLAQRENEFKEIYLELSNQCKEYSCSLLDQCRSTEEVIAVLNKENDSDSEDDNDPDHDNKLTLSRLKLALKYEQKQFVAHPNCQQLLTSIWYEGLPLWRRNNGFIKFLMTIALIIFMPLIAVFYLLFPRSSIGHIIRSPFMKFIYHSASFVFFLLLLILASTRTGGSSKSKQNIRGPAPSIVEWLIFFWVSGMVWAECKQLWEEGFKAYVRQWWNWLDFIMLSLYLATFSLKAVAFLQIQSGKYGPKDMKRAEWPNNDPTLIAEGVFAVANVFSFARIIYLFQTNPHLGPLQISLGCMIIDIAKFLFIFFLVLTSFACGLNQLYWYYDSNTEKCIAKEVGEGVTIQCQRNPDAFMTIGASFSTLIWSLFGLGSQKFTKLVEDHWFIEFVGQGLYMLFHVFTIIVLINMLIAMMSNSYQRIEDHADREWKFARSKLWMGYFDEGSTLPPPFNVVITPKSIIYTLQGIKNLFFEVCIYERNSRSVPMRRRNRQTYPTPPPAHQQQVQNIRISNLNADDADKEVMKRLVSRYIHQIKKQLRQDGVNEDDLLEIKQDISSLRFELREDRKREAARNSGQIESIKRDIVRSLRGGYASEDLPINYRRSNDVSTNPLENLKQEIVSSLRAEIQNSTIRETNLRSTADSNNVHQPFQTQTTTTTQQPPTAAVLPSVNADLYQTHLYTQL